MDWIKRNLYFLIGSLVAVALMGLAGLYLYSKSQLNNKLLGDLDAQYAELKRLSEQKPHPGDKKVDNIALAREQQKQLRAWIQKACAHFQRIPPIPAPETGKVSERDFTYALSRTIDQLQHDAANANVSLPPKNSTTSQTYSFSFEEQRPRLSFAPGSLQPLATQLGEVRAICDVLFAAKINALDSLRRERVSEDDQKGPTTDYIPDASTTNELAVLTPYEITFRGFSSELASALAGFASSPYGIVVKSINVEPAPAAAGTELSAATSPASPTTQPGNYAQYVPPAQSSMPPDRGAIDRSERYNRGARPSPPPTQGGAQPAYGAAGSAATKSKGLPTVLDEKQLRITMALIVVKLTCPK